MKLLDKKTYWDQKYFVCCEMRLEGFNGLETKCLEYRKGVSGNELHTFSRLLIPKYDLKTWVQGIFVGFRLG